MGDAPYVTTDRRRGVRPWPAPQGLLRPWTDEVEAACADGGPFQVTVHPPVVGHGSRLAGLAALLEHVASRTGRSLATRRRIADVCAERLRIGG